MGKLLITPSTICVTSHFDLERNSRVHLVDKPCMYISVCLVVRTTLRQTKLKYKQSKFSIKSSSPNQVTFI